MSSRTMRQNTTSRALPALLLLLTLFAALCGPSATAAGADTLAPPAHTVNIYYFWGDGCPRCAQAKPFLQSLVSTNTPAVQLHDFEVWYNEENQAKMDEYAAAYGIEAQGVPVIFVGEQAWVGFNEQIRAEVADAVRLGLAQGAINPAEKVLAGTTSTSPSNIIRLPFVGAVDVDAKPLLLATAIIAFVDGVNPCSLWVLSLLLGIVVNSGSRRKAAVVGATFLVVAAAAYGVFLVGLLNVFAYVGFVRWIQVAVALFALVFGLVNIKDFFWFRQGPSLTIADSQKPGIYQDIRRIMSQRRLAATAGATAAMALGVTLMELPCTAGFPVVWSSLVAQSNPSNVMFALLLLEYLAIFLLDELALFAIVLYTMRVSRFEEKQGRLLKLIGGCVMLGLALVLLLRPELMDDISGSLAVFAISLALPILIWLIYNRRTQAKKHMKA